MTKTSRLCVAMIVVAMAFFMLISGPVFETTREARAEKITADKFGAETNTIAIQLPGSDRLVFPGKNPVTGSKYDYRKQLGRVKDFFINPKRFISTKVLFLHNLSALEPSDVKKILETIASKTASAIFFVATKAQPGEHASSEYFGASFGLKSSSKISPMTQRIVPEGNLQESLILAGYSAVNSVAPKAWKTIKEPSVDLFIALSEPIDGLEPVGLVIIYDPTDDVGVN